MPVDLHPTRPPTQTHPDLLIMNSTGAAPPPASTFQRWTERDLHESIQATLASRDLSQDQWVFAYGSLLWRPEFEFSEQRPATLKGHHRALCLWSRINRGTPEVPGLVFGLEQGGSCAGMVFKIPAHQVPGTFQTLWAREMMTGAYHPSWIDCETDQGTVAALAFVINRQAPGYAPTMPVEDLVDIVLRAHGKYGSCFDYVEQTHIALEEMGIHDPSLCDLVNRMRARRS